MLKRIVFISFAGLLFGFFLYHAMPSKSEIPAWCGDVENNDGCYEHEECCEPLTDVEFNAFVDDMPKRVYHCSPLINGDCSLEGLYILEDREIFTIHVNDDPEYGCDDTSCHCEWQECYNPPSADDYEGE